MGLTAADYAVLLEPKIGVLPDELLIERVQVVTGATEAEARSAVGQTPDPVEFTVRAGPTLNPLYSRRGSEMVGAITEGAPNLPGGLVIDRIRRRSSNDLAMNQSGGVFADFVAAYPDYQLTITKPDDTFITITNDDIGNLGFGFIDWDTKDEQDVFIASIVTGMLLRFRWTFG